ncbi:hypothetical protein OROGR_032774 [Orobanche gracilis]
MTNSNTISSLRHLHSPNSPPEDEFYSNLWAEVAGGVRQGGRARRISNGIIINEVIDQPTSRRLVDSRASLRPLEVDQSLEATNEALKKDNNEMKKDRDEMKKLKRYDGVQIFKDEYTHVEITQRKEEGRYLIISGE